MLKESAYLHSEYEGETLKAEILGEIDHHSARPIREELDRLLYLYRPSHLEISLQHVSFMDSSGLGLLMGRIALAESLACTVSITNVDARVRRILNLCGLKRITGVVIEEKSEREKTKGEAV